MSDDLTSYYESLLRKQRVVERIKNPRRPFRLDVDAVITAVSASWDIPLHILTGSRP